jgi:hypothetical protein
MKGAGFMATGNGQASFAVRPVRWGYADNCG